MFEVLRPHVFTASVGLVMFSLSSCCCYSLGMSPQSDPGVLTSESRANMTMTFTNHAIFFNEAQLNKFLACLCSFATSLCTISYRLDRNFFLGSKYLFQVFNTTTTTNQTDSSVRASRDDEVFVCNKPYFPSNEQTLSCERRNVRKSAECERLPQHSGVFRWAIRTDACRACRNICWLNSTVNFTTFSSKIDVERGRCGLYPGRRGSVRSKSSTTDAETISLALSQTTPQHKTISKSSFAMGRAVWQENTSILPVSTWMESNVSVSRTKPSPSRDGDDISSVIIYIAVGGTVAVVVIIVLAMGLHRWRKQKDHQSPESKKLYCDDPQPYANSAENDLRASHEASTLPSPSREVAKRFSLNNLRPYSVPTREENGIRPPSEACRLQAPVHETAKRYVNIGLDLTASTVTDNVYNIIPSTESKSPKHTPRNKIVKHEFNSRNDRHTLHTHADIIAGDTARCVGSRTDSRSSLPMRSNPRSTEKFGKTSSLAYGSLKGKAFGPKSRKLHRNAAESSQTYSSLSVKARGPMENAGNVLDTHNMAAGEYKTSSEKQKAEKEGIRHVRSAYFLAQPISNDNDAPCMRQAQRGINGRRFSDIEQTGQYKRVNSSAQSIHSSHDVVYAKPVKDNTLKQRVSDTARCTENSSDPQNTDYFILEDVDQREDGAEAAAGGNGSKSSLERQGPNHQSKNDDIDSTCLDVSNRPVVGGDYFILEDTAWVSDSREQSDDEADFAFLPHWNEESKADPDPDNEDINVYQEINNGDLERTEDAEYAELDEI
ncbi:hypothetical protein ElyMa_005075900 [Elysia marginata]|uniref:Uncharacterized protein n=1 Tax=Elysia marginata TaxID=1093978 RepID=A0AAV4JHI4_9GAST|nr:hypothetical protein ElyMa_005075900 [Elysia marginata]